MRGLLILNVRSTPTPDAIRRTVIDRVMPPPRSRMIVPSNTWMRSRLPSTTLADTFTVSPVARSGRSVRSWSWTISSSTFTRRFPWVVDSRSCGLGEWNGRETGDRCGSIARAPAQAGSRRSVRRAVGRRISRPATIEGEGDGLTGSHRMPQTAGLLELDRAHGLRQVRQQAFVVWSFVRRPGHVLGLHDRFGRADQDRGTLESAALRGDRREAADGERFRELVADSLADLQGLAHERFGGVEVSELPLDHAEVGGFRSDQELVARRADEREPFGHPAAGLDQVTRDLSADAEKVERVRAPRFVSRSLADRERFAGEPPAFRHIRAERDASEATQGLRDQRGIVKAATDLQ